MHPAELVGLATEVAEEGLAAGELPMIEADERLGWKPTSESVRLRVTLEPCLMYLGAAMSLGIEHVAYGVESPGDGAASVAATWQPASDDMPAYRMPTVTGAHRRDECQYLFRRYCETAPESGLRRWAATIAEL